MVQVTQQIRANKNSSRNRILRHKPAALINVPANERLASAAVGAGLLTLGLLRGVLRGAGMSAIGGGLLYRGLTGNCKVYSALGVNRARTRSSESGVESSHGVRVETSIRIHCEPAKVFEFWRNLENLPRVIDHLESVRQLEGKRSHWTAANHLGNKIEWDAEIITEREDEMLAWQSLPDSHLNTAGSIHLESQGGGTIVHLSLLYDPPGGQTVGKIAEFFGIGVQAQLREGLRRMKQLLEAGVEPTVVGQSRGECKS